MIDFDKATGVFHLHNDKVSYVMQVVRDRYLLHRYWGRPLKKFRDTAPMQSIDRAFSPQPAAWPNERTFSLDVLPQEYPSYGHGDYRLPAYEVRLANGTTVTELFYDRYEITAGKPELAGLPAVYAADNDAETLHIYLKDSQGRLAVELLYTLLRDAAMLTRSAKIVNCGSEALDLTNAASFALDFDGHDFDRLSLYGGHAAERSLERVPLMRGVQETGSRRGASSHQQSPFMALARKDTGETTGEVYGFSMVWSGETSFTTEVEQFGTTRVIGGINPFEFKWHLAAGESFQTPEAMLVYSDKGLNCMSQTFHQTVREHIVRGKYQHELRPILVNNWEATYFDFDEEKIDNLAQSAADLGLELLVLDDGWFGKRNDDNSSLGDWFVNTDKLKQGLKGVAASAHKRGLKFGLWFEPEMISEDSELYRAHPDWTLHVPDYQNSFSRHQLVLDLSRPEVCDYIVKSVGDVLSSAEIDYVKWDFNRHLTEAFSAALPSERQGETKTRFVLGLYDILERLTAQFPHVLWESCSGGGGRFDAGMLYYMPQTWTSDNTDAVCRLSIQSGTSYVFPPLTMGAHVSVTPNHQVGRVTSLQTRTLCAFAGDFGYELDITRMSAEEKEQVKKHVALYKRLRPTLQLGKFYRLLTPFAGTKNETAWQFVSADGKEVVVLYFKTLAEPATPLRKLQLTALEADAEYEVTDYLPAQRTSMDFGGEKSLQMTGQVFYGDELMYNGLGVEKIDTDFAAYMWVLTKK
ncbi:alpha-galactosidase [Selenomonas sp. AE3005]|uniref:alpha-galactosidase n=1 Tax=Selenomonas sp. AE3005 TaxID=1485543 RepID=UPI0025F96467|nr:alpha-galactosidase [Selenomonas sp. AE3005]